MKIRWIVQVVAIICLAFAYSTSAQMGFHAPQMRGLWNPVVGNGATYQLKSSNGKDTQMEWAVVAKESVDGKDGFWMEMTTSDSSGRGAGMVVKDLMMFDGNDMTIQKIVMQMPGRPPMEMPMQMSQMGSHKQITDVSHDSEDVGKETITTPAGTFECEHYRSKDGGDAWVSPKVSPFGLVKSQSKDTSMTLVSVTTDAKDKITGTPQVFNPMQMMQQQQPPQP
jgi:hypothetical protein